MRKTICNTSPLLYLYRIDSIELLPALFKKVLTTSPTAEELRQGQIRGHDVPTVGGYDWLKIKDPKTIPSEWYSLDLGAGELHSLALGLENRDSILLFDDMLARRIAQAAGLEVWGTLRVLLEAKKAKIITEVKPFAFRLRESGLGVSDEIIERISKLANE